MAINCDNLHQPGPNSASVIRWPATRELAADTDNVAAVLGTPNYLPLLQDNDTPFPAAAVTPVEFWVEFLLLPATALTKEFPIVQENVLMDPAVAGQRLQLPEPFLQLARLGELYFQHEADDCWCMSMFKVKWAGAYYLETVEEPNASCSCQVIRVPKAGEKLDYGQKIVPAAYATDWSYRNAGLTLSGEFQDEGPRCEKVMSFRVSYTFHYTLDPAIAMPPGIDRDPKLYFMRKASRHMKGKLVWAIRRKWFQAIKERIDQIIACGNCGGAKYHAVYKNGVVPLQWIAEGCEVTFADLQWTLKQKMVQEGHAETPGCMSDPGKLPWSTATCGGEECGALNDGGAKGNDFPGGQQPVGNAPVNDFLVYCDTLKQFESLILNIPNQVKPLGDTFIPVDYYGFAWPIEGQANPRVVSLPSTVERVSGFRWTFGSADIFRMPIGELHYSASIGWDPIGGITRHVRLSVTGQVWTSSEPSSGWQLLLTIGTFIKQKLIPSAGDQFVDVAITEEFDLGQFVDPCADSLAMQVSSNGTLQAGLLVDELVITVEFLREPV